MEKSYLDLKEESSRIRFPLHILQHNYRHMIVLDCSGLIYILRKEEEPLYL